MYDYLLKNGTIIDGTGRNAYVADLAISGRKIAQIGDVDPSEARITIDATGKQVTPGFIDTHSHADSSLFLFPDCESYLRQGITTFIGGNCGDSNAPIHSIWVRKYWEYDLWQEMDPFVFYPNIELPVDTVRQAVLKHTGENIGWRSFGEYLDVVRGKGMGVNMIPQIGHSQLRADVMGPKSSRRPTSEEIILMKGHITEAMESGAWGLSVGRDYPPSAYADMEEMDALLSHTKARHGFFSIHWKRTGLRNNTSVRPNMLDGVVEALEYALQTGIKTEISHLVSGYEVYPSNPEMERVAAEETLKVIDSYIARGVDVAFDVIPGKSGGICCGPFAVSTFFTPWIKMSGSVERFVNNLKIPEYRSNLVTAIYEGKWYNLNPKINPEWDKKTTVIRSSNPRHLDKSVHILAKELRMDPVELVLHLIVEDPNVMVRKEQLYDASIKALLQHPRASVCTDTYAFDRKGFYGLNSEHPELLPHPHTYCAFPKFLLEMAMGSLEENIRKITGFPAEFFEIEKRGTLQEGHFADIVVMDLSKLRTNENYIEPRQFPEGIEQVFVNGGRAVQDSCFTGNRAGLILVQ